MTKEINQPLHCVHPRSVQGRLCPTILVLLLAALVVGLCAPASPVWAQAEDETLDEELTDADATSSDAETSTDSDGPQPDNRLLLPGLEILAPET